MTGWSTLKPIWQRHRNGNQVIKLDFFEHQISTVVGSEATSLRVSSILSTRNCFDARVCRANSSMRGCIRLEKPHQGAKNITKTSFSSSKASLRSYKIYNFWHQFGAVFVGKPSTPLELRGHDLQSPSFGVVLRWILHHGRRSEPLGYLT